VRRIEAEGAGVLSTTRKFAAKDALSGGAVKASQTGLNADFWALREDPGASLHLTVQKGHIAVVHVSSAAFSTQGGNRLLRAHTEPGGG